MKFESKYGLGEICIYNECKSSKGREMKDVLVKITGIKFEIDGQVSYTCEYTTQHGLFFRMPIHENMLTGDPDFDQETGYPDDLD